ncbi:MAG: heparinase II/III family protein [Thermodesulfobacteriota bacterium]
MPCPGQTSSSCVAPGKAGIFAFLVFVLLLTPRTVSAVEHPFLLFAAQELPRLRAAAATTHSEIWQAIQGFADQHLGQVPPGAPASNQAIMAAGNKILPFAFAFRLTGDARYGLLAKSWILGVCSYPHWGLANKVDNDLPAAHLVTGVSLGLDWAWEAFTPAERRLVLAKLTLQADRLLAAARSGWWGPALGSNHNWVNHAALGLAGLLLPAVTGQDHGWLLAAQNNTDAVLADLAGVGDGSHHEGIHYADYGARRLVLLLQALRQNGHPDRFDHPWLRQLARWHLYVTLPNPEFVLNIADSYYPFQGSLALIRGLAAEYRDGHAEWLARQWLARPTIATSETRATHAPLEFLAFDPTVAPQPPDDLPTSTLFPDWGVAVMRSGWEPDATYLAFKSGAPGGRFRFETARRTGDTQAVGFGHNHPDQNSIMLYSQGLPLALDPGYQMPKWSRDHNTVIVDGQGQVGEGWLWLRSNEPELLASDGAIAQLTSLPGFDYCLGQAANAYPDHLGLTRFDRSLLFIKPNLVVMTDRLEADQPHRYELVLRNLGDGFQLQERWLVSRMGLGRLATWIAAPRAFRLEVDHGRGPHNWQYPQGVPGPWHRARLRPAEEATTARFTTVLFPGRADEDLPLVGQAASGAARRIAVQDGADLDLIFLANGSASWSFPSAASDGRQVVLRRQDGQLARLLLRQGSYLALQGEAGRWTPVVQALGGSATVEVDYEPGAVAVSCQPGDEAPSLLAVHAPAAETVLLNGVAQPFARDGELVLLRLGRADG